MLVRSIKCSAEEKINNPDHWREDHFILSVFVFYFPSKQYPLNPQILQNHLFFIGKILALKPSLNLSMLSNAKSTLSETVSMYSPEKRNSNRRFSEGKLFFS